MPGSYFHSTSSSYANRCGTFSFSNGNKKISLYVGFSECSIVDHIHNFFLENFVIAA